MSKRLFLDKKVLVLGGSGFIGSYAVKALLAQNAQVTVGSRYPGRPHRRLPDCSSRIKTKSIKLEDLRREVDWIDLLTGTDVVINCVGILRQRPGETYDFIHHQAPAAAARACRTLGIRFVHVSALGLDAGLSSRFLISKRDGEQAIQNAGGDWHIVRPSLVDGDSGYGAHWVRKVAEWPVHIVPRNATGKIAAIDARDLGEALANLALHEHSTENRIYELGGAHEHPIAVQLLRMRNRQYRPLRLNIPVWMARLASHVCDLFHITPFSFGHYQLLQNDNVPSPNRLSELLQKPPRRVGHEKPGSGAIGVPAGEQKSFT